MLIAPLINHLQPGALPTVFGLSGYSGAGTVPTSDPDGRPTSAPKVTPESLGGGVKPYSLTDHIHEREAGHHLSQLLPNAAGPLKIAFIPAVTPWFSGIISTVSIPLKGKLTAREVVALFEEKYKDDKLVKLIKEVPQLHHIEGKHTVTIGGFQVHSDRDRVVIVVCIIWVPPVSCADCFFRVASTIFLRVLQRSVYRCVALPCSGVRS
jgi:N-acetyl-gamma-glutamyl-phosphate reductase/acetylglutamate kinase